MKFARVLVQPVLSLLCLSMGHTAERAFKFPEKQERSGVQGGFWDVGACYVSGQPTEGALKELAKEGVKTVICLRGVAEMDDRSVVPFDEPGVLKDLGINYVHIPMGEDSEYNPTVVERFARALDRADGRVLLHCTVAWRASYVWAGYLNRLRGVPLDEAVHVGESMNFSANRFERLLGAKTTYAASKSRVGAVPPRMPRNVRSDSKVKVGVPVALRQDPDDFMAFALWQMGDVFNSSQPTEEQFHELRSKGVKTIINVRTDEEMKTLGFDEEAVVKSLGMEYVHVPLQDLGTYTPENLAKIAAAIEGSKGKTLLHCNTATRTSSVWIAYLVKYHGFVLDDAVRHGEAMRFSNLFPKLLGHDLVYKLKPKSNNRVCGEG